MLFLQMYSIPILAVQPVWREINNGVGKDESLVGSARIRDLLLKLFLLLFFEIGWTFVCILGRGWFDEGTRTWVEATLNANFYVRVFRRLFNTLMTWPYCLMQILGRENFSTGMLNLERKGSRYGNNVPRHTHWHGLLPLIYNELRGGRRGGSAHVPTLVLVVVFWESGLDWKKERTAWQGGIFFLDSKVYFTVLGRN